ncbi:hypothetical protein EVAR_85458_1 [Eumeta japonica]|uniref:Uncharacterized protein n=1 Tax=Eumeta variegata TaxID=151549 RepID=A0A4C1WM90_EUMVA|nr:hypothetical protein EVAR_85458_1 [Eumeta japonica]
MQKPIRRGAAAAAGWIQVNNSLLIVTRVRAKCARRGRGGGGRRAAIVSPSTAAAARRAPSRVGRLLPFMCSLQHAGYPSEQSDNNVIKGTPGTTAGIGRQYLSRGLLRSDLCGSINCERDADVSLGARRDAAHARPELVAVWAPRGARGARASAGRRNLVEAMRLMRITKKCVFDDIFRRGEEKKKTKIRNSKRDSNAGRRATYYRPARVRFAVGRASALDIKCWHEKALLSRGRRLEVAKLEVENFPWRNLCGKRLNFMCICTAALDGADRLRYRI